MKNSFSLFVLILIAGTILFSGCKKKEPEPGPNALEEQTARLSKTWIPATAVTFDGNADSRFDNFQVSFNSNGTYTSQNGAPVFRTSGTWVFKDTTNPTTVVLDGRPEFNITLLNETQLKGTVELSGGINARTTEVDGIYVFDLKQP